MKVLSEKISRRHAPGRGPFRGITHLECESIHTDSIRLRGNPASLEIVANNAAAGRRFTIRLDALETMRIAEVIARAKKPDGEKP